MRLDEAMLERIADLVVSKLSAKLFPLPHVPSPMKKMTVQEFAAAIQRGPEFVRREIRLGRIPAAVIDGPPYLLSPRALARFDVTVEEAQHRIALWKRAQNQPPESEQSAA